jgi:integrase
VRSCSWQRCDAGALAVRGSATEDGRAAAARRAPLERGTVTVAEQLLEVNGAFSVRPPTSAASRPTVTLPAVVVEALAEHLARYTAKSPEAIEFLSSQGTHLRRSNVNHRVWQPAIRAADVEGLRVHDPRHTAGTLAAAAGGSFQEVMDRLGRGHRPGAEPADRGG